MKKLISFLLVFSMILSLLSGCSKKQEPYNREPQIEVGSTAVYLYNLDLDMQIYGAGIDTHMRPGSLVHLMTAVVAYEAASSLDLEIKSNDYTFKDISGKALHNIDMYEDETYTVRDLLSAMLIGDAHDAANLLAQHFGEGEIPAFVAKMNAKASEIGMKSTKFMDPNGLVIDQQATTAQDMFLLARYIYNNCRELISIANRLEYTIDARSGQNEYTVTNTNLLIRSDSSNYGYYCSYAQALKYTSTENAGDCLISLAEKDNMTYILVTLRAPYTGSDYSEIKVRIPKSQQTDDVQEDEDDGNEPDPSSSTPEENSSSKPEEDASSSSSSSSSGTSSSTSGLNEKPGTSDELHAYLDTTKIYEWAYSTTMKAAIPQGGVIFKMPLRGDFDKTEVSVGLEQSLSSFLPSGVTESDITLFCFRYANVTKEVEKGDIMGQAYVIGYPDLTHVNLVAMESSQNSNFLGGFITFLLSLVLILICLAVILLVIRQINLNRARKIRAAKRQAAKKKQQHPPKSNMFHDDF